MSDRLDRGDKNDETSTDVDASFLAMTADNNSTHVKN
jgi:hypothetical protein